MRQLLLLNVASLERARVERGLFKYELAELAGVSVASVSEAFNSGNVGLGVARALCKVLQLDLREVLVRHGGEERDRA